MSQQFHTQGTHVFVDVFEWEKNIKLEDSIEAAQEAGMIVLSYMLIPDANSHAVLLAESHISHHRKPGYIALDIFTCGDKDPMVIAQRLLDKMNATKYNIRVMRRGDSAGLYFLDEQQSDVMSSQKQDLQVAACNA